MYHHAAIVVVTTAVATAECRISQLKLIITVPVRVIVQGWHLLWKEYLEFAESIVAAENYDHSPNSLGLNMLKCRWRGENIITSPSGSNKQQKVPCSIALLSKAR